MARPLPLSQNVSFQEIPPSRRVGRDEQLPPPPSKGTASKLSLAPTKSNSSGAIPTAPPLRYDDSYNDAGFSASNGADVRRKKSMVKPERERIDPNHRLWHYREHAAEDGMNVLPSCMLCF